MKLGVIAFPGSTYADTVYAIEALPAASNIDIEVVGQNEGDLSAFDAIILPSGASYGDYLRPGAIAATTAVIDALKEFADNGGLVVGFGNGFQILTEVGLLPGALLQNEGVNFICATPTATVTTAASAVSGSLEPGQQVKLPVAHGFGNYWCDAQTLSRLEENDQIVLQYEDALDGSLNNIAGICNDRGNVVGMMPLPERATDLLLESVDGVAFLQSIITTSEPVEA